jgi:hypothetical protein
MLPLLGLWRMKGISCPLPGFPGDFWPAERHTDPRLLSGGPVTHRRLPTECMMSGRTLSPHQSCILGADAQLTMHKRIRSLPPTLGTLAASHYASGRNEDTRVISMSPCFLDLKKFQASEEFHAMMHAISLELPSCFPISLRLQIKPPVFVVLVSPVSMVLLQIAMMCVQNPGFDPWHALSLSLSLSLSLTLSVSLSLCAFLSHTHTHTLDCHSIFM